MKVLLNQTKGNIVSLNFKSVEIFVFIEYILIKIMLLKINNVNREKNIKIF